MTSRGPAITLLGRLSIGREAAATAFPGRRSELVFAYLAAEHRRDVSRDELADALWPHELPDAWAAALRGVVSDVRRVIEAGGLHAGDWLVRTGSGYRLRLPPDAAVDLDEARTELAAARTDLERAPARAASAAMRSADLARLPFLPRHEGRWVDGVRRELQDIRVEALELATRAHVRAGDMRAAAATAGHLVEVDPYSDAAHRLRIEVLGAAGDTAGALSAYKQCHAALVEQVGVEPSAETKAALQRALEPAPAPRTPEALSPPSSPLASLSVLVVDDHDFQRRTALTLLGRLGVSALSEARGGTEALELLSACAPDVIICDIDMPGMDGVEFIRHIAERRLAGAVVVASGLERSVLNAVEAVGHGYGLQVLGSVEKPLTARRLSELLATYRRPPTAGHVEALSETELHAALDDGRIDVRFEPIVDLKSGLISGAGTVPWLVDAGRTVAADQMSAQLAPLFTDYLLEAACDCVGELDDLALWTPIVRSALADVGVADRLLGVVRGRAIDPRRIVLTVGEHQVRHSSPAELDVLTRLRVKGFGVCLENYGAGHLSDEALRRIPVTALLLTPQLVRGAAADPLRTAALEEALDAAGGHGLPAIAGGCDDADDYELLLQLGCSHARGNFISPPIERTELAARARDWGAPGTAW